AQEAVSNLQEAISVRFLEMIILNSEQDTIAAAKLMQKQGVSAIVTLGGDGTNRAVALGTCEVPIMPLSTGTNNVFPFLIEGTLAGMAAGTVACHLVDKELCAPRCKKMSVYKSRNMAMDLVDMALVDIAISTETYVGARVIWDINTVSEIFLAVAKPDSIGLSSIGGLTNPISATDSHGLHIEIEKQIGSKYVSAPLTAGNIAKVGIKSISNMVPDHAYVVKKTPCTIALDGERSIPLRDGDSITIILTGDGPPVIDPHKTLKIVGQNKVYFKD
ncbi:MAG: NAD(+)/NADH kinase, partial [SAR202 cluster bacterium]|nr:NAD(+)/NADH kinase [SAR202 cluster bacterium]